MSERLLTTAQVCRLDKLADEDEGARVVGWLGEAPVVRRTNGAHVRVQPPGRLMAVRTWPQ